MLVLFLIANTNTHIQTHSKAITTSEFTNTTYQHDTAAPLKLHANTTLRLLPNPLIPLNNTTQRPPKEVSATSQATTSSAQTAPTSSASASSSRRARQTPQQTPLQRARRCIKFVPLPHSTGSTCPSTSPSGSWRGVSRRRCTPCCTARLRTPRVMRRQGGGAL